MDMWFNSVSVLTLAGDRHSVGSEGSLGSVRSAGSGQSCEGSGLSSALLIENAQVGIWRPFIL